jgi:hypothetical protein
MGALGRGVALAGIPALNLAVHLRCRFGGDLMPARLLTYTLLVALGLVYLAAGAAAAPTTLAVDEPQPQKQAGVVVVSTYTGSSTFDVKGAVDADIVVSSAGVATGLDLESADLTLSDVTIVFETPTSFPGYFYLVDVTATLSGPAALFTGSSGATSFFDLDGSQLIFDSGYARIFDPFTWNDNYMFFSQNPVAFFYGPGSIAEVTVTSLGTDEAAVSLSLPLDLTVVDPTGSPGTVTFWMSGDLEVSGTVIPEPPIPVEIDIRPWSDINPVNPFARGVIPVAILGSEAFDVADVDVTTLAFGPSEAVPAHRQGGHFQDVNADGLTDLLSHYRTQETGIAVGDTEACAAGETLDGTPFEGCDSINTQPNCGNGFQAALVLPPVVWIGGRMRRRR